MPAGFIPNEGLSRTLTELLGKTTHSMLPWQLMLWKNNIVPDYDVVLADLVEADFGGYSRVDLTRSEWQSPTIHDGCAHTTWGVEAFTWYVTSGPTQTIYGFAYINTSEGKIRYIQRLDPEDIRPVSVGGKVVMLPTYTLTSAECEE